MDLAFHYSALGHGREGDFGLSTIAIRRLAPSDKRMGGGNNVLPIKAESLAALVVRKT